MLVLAAWAAALAWLALRDRAFRQEADGAMLRLTPGSAFYRITVGGRRMGLASLAVDTLPDGFRVTTQLALDLDPADSLNRIVYSEDAALSRSLWLRRLGATLSGAWGSYRLTGRWWPGDTLLGLTMAAAGAPPVVSFVPVTAQASLPTTVPFRLVVSGRLDPGRSAVLTVFDPVVQAATRREVRVAGDSTFVLADSAAFDPAAGSWSAARLDTVRAWRLDQVEYGVPTVTWVDDRGFPVLRETALGVRYERMAFELARERGRIRHPPAAPSLDEARRRVPGGVPVGGSDPPPPPDSLPHPPPASAALQRLVAEIAGPPGRKDASQVAAALAGWVRSEVGPTPPGGPLPVDTVARRRAGTADDRAALLVALARAAGIPARTVAGLLPREGGPPIAGAWADVWLDRWVRVDLRPDSAPADSVAVPLTVGGRAHPLHLLPLAGGVVPWPERPRTP